MSTTAPSGAPPRHPVQARVFRIVNVPMRAVLGLPFPTPLGRRLMLVHHTGRRTGRHYRQPVSYVRLGDDLLTPGGGRWTENLRDGEPVRLTLRGRSVTASPELVRDQGDVSRLFDAMAARNPALRRFVPIPRSADGRLDPDRLAQAIRYGFCIVRWRVEPPTSCRSGATALQ
jgi:deazaflavin-dependent oxidoreductase (nitroreductase family)